ncbi:MAG: phosphoribosylaminoimidazolesuccinocarboxamide synthase, partial [Leptospirales bacterium]|nr:phosphoribosylaminoimidazolesuccinocarboxamide synthase [Leptospirales bacterium]
MNALTDVKIPGLEKKYSGKVRDIYDVDEKHMIIVSSDRVSAFDYVFPNGIPGKGIILNSISNIWFSKIDFVENHIVETSAANFPKPFSNYAEILDGRSVLVKKAKRIDFECIARGYIIGTGWKDYQATGAICGIPLPKGLRMADKLEKPIFTPSTKADAGHDENVSIEVMGKSIGMELAEQISELTVKIYAFARDTADPLGIILADTKLEFGFADDKLILIDEVLTPDSSRFWDKSKYVPGSSPVSFDKQFIRDYLD